jgi:hypothetical protein
MSQVQLGRNSPCSCGSGKKYKRCCARGSSAKWEPGADLPEEPFAGRNPAPPRTGRTATDPPGTAPKLVPPGTIEAGTKRVIEGTPEHPFYAYGKGWIPLKDVKPGDWLRTAEGWTRVSAVRDPGRQQPVYNLRVAGHSTYFVGTPEWGFAVWAHNHYLDAIVKLVESGQLKEGTKSTDLLRNADTEGSVQARIRDLLNKVPGEYWKKAWGTERSAYEEQFGKDLSALLRKGGWLDGELSATTATEMTKTAGRAFSKGQEAAKADLSKGPSENPFSQKDNPALYEAFEAFKQSSGFSESYRIMQDLHKAGIEGRYRVLEGLLTGGNARVGAEFQLKVADYYLKQGNLENVELKVDSKRIDVLTKDGFGIELKNWGTSDKALWGRNDETGRNNLIGDIETQTANYLRGTKYKLRVWFSNELPGLQGRMEGVGTRLNEQFSGRFDWQAGWPPKPPKPPEPPPPKTWTQGTLF